MAFCLHMSGDVVSTVKLPYNLLRFFVHGVCYRLCTAERSTHVILYIDALGGILVFLALPIR